MRTTTLLAFTASVSAIAAPDPMITAAPRIRRDLFDGLHSIISGADALVSSADAANDDIKSGISSIKSDVTSIVGQVTSGAGDVISAGKSAISGIYSNAEQASTCVSLASKLVDSDPPEATGDLEDAIESIEDKTTVADNCIATFIPSKLSSSFAALETSSALWYSSYSGLLASYSSLCPTVSGVNIQAAIPCSTVLAQVTGASSAASGSGSSGAKATGTGSSSNSTSDTSGASLNRGMAAGAIAGIVGAVALF